MTIRERLETLADEKNAEFAARLAPGIERERFLGVRLPALRKLAKELRGTPEASEFLAALPHETVDGDILHAMLISDLRDYETALDALERFLPFVDNWMVCDTFRPVAVKKRLGEFRGKIEEYLSSDRPYIQRFGIEMLMWYYLGEAFEPSQLTRVAEIESEHYYVRMMQAWYFATALAKQYDSAIRVLEERKLEKWTHNKTIQKAIESYRVSDEHKAYLKTLREK